MLAYEMQIFSNKLDAEKILSFSYDFYKMSFPFTTIPGRFNGDSLPSILCASIPVLIGSNCSNKVTNSVALG